MLFGKDQESLGNYQESVNIQKKTSFILQLIKMIIFIKKYYDTEKMVVEQIMTSAMKKAYRQLKILSLI